MVNRNSGLGVVRQIALAVSVTMATTALFVLTPIGYSKFSWQALGQPYNEGAVCLVPSECASNFCTDGVCCDTECSGEDEACNISGNVGMCTSTVAMAPALSSGGYAVAIAALFFGGLLGLYSRRHEQ